MRAFIPLVSLFAVLAVAGYSYREWGRRLAIVRTSLPFELRRLPNSNLPYYVNAHQQEFDEKHWLPLKVYELTGGEFELELGAGVSICGWSSSSCPPYLPQ